MFYYDFNYYLFNYFLIINLDKLLGCKWRNWQHVNKKTFLTVIGCALVNRLYTHQIYDGGLKFVFSSAFKEHIVLSMSQCHTTVMLVLQEHCTVLLNIPAMNSKVAAFESSVELKTLDLVIVCLFGLLTVFICTHFFTKIPKPLETDFQICPEKEPHCRIVTINISQANCKV